MNTARTSTLLPRETRIHDHPPEPVASSHLTMVRRVGLLDRLALRVGVALITWSRRPLTIESNEHRAHRVEQYRARLERELAAERMRLLGALRW